MVAPGPGALQSHGVPVQCSWWGLVAGEGGLGLWCPVMAFFLWAGTQAQHCFASSRPAAARRHLGCFAVSCCSTVAGSAGRGGETDPGAVQSPEPGAGGGTGHSPGVA